MRPRTWISHIDAAWPALAILLLPFGVFYWLVPLFSSLTIGNDYGVFPIQQQLELLFSQRTGTFPLYAPGFAEGRSQAALTMGQQFHPLPYLASLIPGYHDGHALQINTLLRLCSLGVAHLALFYLFRRLGLTRLAAFLVAFLTVYNQRMLDCFRYGASLENHTAFLFLFASLGFLWHKPRHYAGPLLVAFSTWLLCCGGHPQMMYLGFLGAALICALIPFAFPAFADDPRPPWRDIRRYYLTCAAALLAGILLSAAYLASFYFEFIADNAARVGRDYAWSLIYTDTLGGLLNNFFAPLQSDVHGAFGSSALILLPLFILFIPTRRQMAPWAVVAFAVLAALTVLIAAGDATPLHRWFWEYLPLANAFRVPGRIVFFLPALLAIPLAWLLRPVDTLTTRRGRTWPVSPLFLPALLALAAYLVYHFFLLDTLPPPGHFHPNRIHSAPAWLAPALFRLHLAALVLA
ncbi:MAG: hypothetical protein M0R76_04440, partial [Proteobacteria bacterium]|nr:hypothetical protein [Pseudomonadota bacterium]